MTLRQAINKDVLPGDWHIPAGTILLLSMGAMMRYDDVILVVSVFLLGERGKVWTNSLKNLWHVSACERLNTISSPVSACSTTCSAI